MTVLTQTKSANDPPSSAPIVVAALYHFTEISDYRALRAPLLALCRDWQLRGTLLLAAEGINGTVAGSRAAVDALLARLRSDPRLAGLRHQESFLDAAAAPFQRLKVRLKQEIVSLGVTAAQADPARRRGLDVAPEDWHQLLDDPAIPVLDLRNDFESAIGYFAGALAPPLSRFGDFPAYAKASLNATEQPRIAMYCTGGIRCEKASSYLLHQGFQQVYQLRGGILNYLRKVPAAASRWRGECFVFDERVALDHALQPGRYRRCCRVCRLPLTAAELESAAAAGLPDDRCGRQSCGEKSPSSCSVAAGALLRPSGAVLAENTELGVALDVNKTGVV